MNTSCRSFLRLTALAIVCLSLINCGGNKPIDPVQDPQQIDINVTEQVGALLDQARTSESPERDVLYLRAAELVFSVNEDDWARNLLVAIDADLLSSDDFVSYTLLFSRIAIDDNAYFLAQRVLTNPRIEQQWAYLDGDAIRELRQRRAELFTLLGEPINSVGERVLLTPYLDEEAQATNQDVIWQNLMSLPTTELQTLRDGATNTMLKGWYSLAVLSKATDQDLARQQASIEQWMQDWPSHPATLKMPRDLTLLRELVQNQPQQVALLLPLKGELSLSGKAIRDGFMAAYFAAKARGSQTPQVRLFDTSEGDIDRIYDLAVADGAQMIIGPLRKEQVSVLNTRLDITVPTLALNNADLPLGQLYQFGLAVEDEAKQVARRAWLEGQRYAMVVTPTAAYGQRSAEAFQAEWEKLGGTVVKTTSYNSSDDYATLIKQSFLVSESEQRGRRIRSLVGNVKFEPRRRQDIDFIFLVAQPQEARQIKPTLALYFANDVPVYATRHLYSGVANPSADRDLNGVRFNTLPWVFDNSSPEKQAVTNFAQPAADYSRLYALGVDAYHLYPRIRQLEEVTGARYYGATGSLRLLANRQIEREQTWAQIINGEAKPLPQIVSEAVID